ncbi:dTDP-4-dehydro-6-deoxyglucose aminotransferase [Arenicella chitinivorans]|uniref:dTDP-4-dehydro-6-deoxyglucose aminotransferase n=1 Tax=Arenicella chitinivorans TaxID=1329800 RepID=A0A918RTZ2_9GAMM|nr:DegT/DnrJ/EryC1/StrS family aminotransferase [Arenicella chitinivorans]GHA08341.1 dTDP-4-dehydro-6-deoxyglucose aminotransferase [Arenicella chitinivorans]
MLKPAKQFFVGRPNIGNRDALYQRVDSIFDSYWLTNDGGYVRELEAKLADYLDVEHCIAMCNGTVALELAIRATGMTGNVLVPAMTFIATAHALQWQQIRPVFVDIDPHSLNICPAAAERMIDETTTGILGVHLYGRPCDIKSLSSLAEKHDLRLVFDAAHAFGSSYQGRKLGGFGDCEVFSFHATKVFNTFEGGAVTTNDSELAARLRLMRNFGFEGEDAVSYIGTNGKMAEINAAMGLTNFEQVDAFINVNKENYQAYQAGLRDVSGVRLIDFDENELNNYQYVIIEIDAKRAGRTRDELKRFLSEHGVVARRYFYPGCHRMEPYRSLYPQAGENLPATEAFSEVMLAMPTGTQITTDEVSQICETIREYLRA